LNFIYHCYTTKESSNPKSQNYPITIYTKQNLIQHHNKIKWTTTNSLNKTS